MTKQFTADEVRQFELAYRGAGGVSKVLVAFADRLEADEKAVPVGEILTREPDESCTRIRWDDDFRFPEGAKLYTHPDPADTARLAEALRLYCEQMETFQPQGELGAMHGAGMAFAYRDAAKTIRGLLTAHSAQAQPPAESAPIISAFLDAAEHNLSKSPLKNDYALAALNWLRGRLAAQENLNG